MEGGWGIGKKANKYINNASEGNLREWRKPNAIMGSSIRSMESLVEMPDLKLRILTFCRCLHFLGACWSKVSSLKCQLVELRYGFCKRKIYIHAQRKSIKDTKATDNRDIYYKEPYAHKHEMRNNHGIGFVLRWARAIQLSAHCMYGSRCSWQTSAKLTPQFPAPRKNNWQ